MSDNFIKNKNIDLDGVVLTDAQKKSLRARNIAVGLVLIGLVVLFYVATFVKFGPAILDRAI